MQYRPVADRFWEKVDKQNETECWNWTASLHTCGYGALNIDNVKCSAHRISWELHNGPIPIDNDGATLHVLHTCDNPSCVNPKHLFLGTHQDNMSDMAKKKRGGIKFQLGEANSSAKLTNIYVREIKELLKIGELTQRAIAIKYNISYKVINSIAKGKSWIHI